MFPSRLRDRIARLEHESLTRAILRPSGIDFTSNDYLGFASDPTLTSRWRESLRDLPLSGSGSRLLRGGLGVHDTAERALARFSGQESALLFPSGYQANVGLLSALLRPEDTVFSDALNHASIIDGIRLSRAKRFVYPHLDLVALERALEAQTGDGLRIIVTESIFSMEGDIAPLKELAAIAERTSSLLIVDEAHATGLYRGGLANHLGLANRVFATVHTGGKALGAAGAWIAGSRETREYLIQFSRAFIYSTAPLPAQAQLLKLAVEYWEEVGPQRAQELFQRIDEFRHQLPEGAWGARAPGPIIPIRLGDNDRALAVAVQLQQAGFDIRAIRPPTVPEGGARLRIIVHWQNSAPEVQRLAKALTSLLEAGT